MKKYHENICFAYIVPKWPFFLLLKLRGHMVTAVTCDRLSVKKTLIRGAESETQCFQRLKAMLLHAKSIASVC